MFDGEPDAYAAYTPDGINLLLAALAKAGLNRGKIMDALRATGVNRVSYAIIWRAKKSQAKAKSPRRSIRRV